MHAINPWISIWLKPKLTIAWLRDNSPLYGVVVIIVLTVVLSLISAAVIPETAAQKDEFTAGHRIGRWIDILVLPVLMVALIYWVGAKRGGVAQIVNVLSVMVWSQLPMILLSAITILLTLAGYAVTGPLMANEISFEDGTIRLTPPLPEINFAAYLHFMFSTIFIIWSFKILLTGLAEVQQVSAKRTMGILMIALLLLMVARLPITLVLGDFNLMEAVGLGGVFENT